jgi:hypothetical protein
LYGFSYSHEFVFIIKQPYIKGDKESDITVEDIDAFMIKEGFEKGKYNGIFYNGKYKIIDASPYNFVKGKDGLLYCIDPIISLRT